MPYKLGTPKLSGPPNQGAGSMAYFKHFPYDHLWSAGLRLRKEFNAQAFGWEEEDLTSDIEAVSIRIDGMAISVGLSRVKILRVLTGQQQVDGLKYYGHITANTYHMEVEPGTLDDVINALKVQYVMLG